MSNPIRHLLIARNSLNGAVCAIFMHLAYKKNADILFVRNNREATAALFSCVKADAWKKYRDIFISDVGVNLRFTEDETDGDAVLDRITLFGSLDKVQISVAEKYEARIGNDLPSADVSTAELFYDYLLTRRLIHPRPFFIDTVCHLPKEKPFAIDTAVDESHPLSSMLSVMFSALGIKYFVPAFVSRLAEKDVDDQSILTQYERDVVAFYIRQSDEMNNKLLNEMRIVKRGKYMFGIIVVDNVRNPALLKLICEKRNLDVGILINVNTGFFRAYTAKADVHVGSLVTDAFGFGCGGTREVGIGRVHAEILYDFFSSLVSRFKCVEEKSQDEDIPF